MVIDQELLFTDAYPASKQTGEPVATTPYAPQGQAGRQRPGQAGPDQPRRRDARRNVGTTMAGHGGRYPRPTKGPVDPVQRRLGLDCSQATGNTLEVAIGTSHKLPLYPPGIRLTEIDHSPAMLDIAKQRTQGLDHTDSQRAIARNGNLDPPRPTAGQPRTASNRRCVISTQSSSEQWPDAYAVP